MKASIALLAVVSLILLPTLAQARIGDNTARSLLRYGKPVASTGVAGKLTSTKTFQVSPLLITCGYVNGTVQMIKYARPDRPFNPGETQVVLSTNSKRQPWMPPGFANGTYHMTNGTIATVKENVIEIHTPAWQDALDTDNGVKKAPPAPAAGTNAAPAATPSTTTPSTTTTPPPVSSTAAPISSTAAPAPMPSTAPATPSTTTNSP